MEYIYIGKIANTHGIKGELRIKSNFKYKQSVFKLNNNLYIGKTKQIYQIVSYRVHKDFDMVTFKGITNINEVLNLKGENAYVNRDELTIDGYLDEDIIGLKAFIDNKNIGIVTEIFNNNAHDIIVIKNKERQFLIPNLDNFIERIDLDKKEIHFINMEGLIDEN